MPDIEERLEALEARLRALTVLVLSDIAASAHHEESIAEAALDMAESQSRIAAKAGAHRAAVELNALIGEARSVVEAIRRA